MPPAADLAKGALEKAGFNHFNYHYDTPIDRQSFHAHSYEDQLGQFHAKYNEGSYDYDGGNSSVTAQFDGHGHGLPPEFHNHGIPYGDDDYFGDDEDGFSLTHFMEKYGAGFLLFVFLVVFLPQLLGPCWQDLKNLWQRRVQAARYRKVGGTAEMANAEEDVGFFDIVSSSLTAGPVVECVIDLNDGKEPRKCEACVAELEKISELPFVLTDACKASADPSLNSLSLVDLFLRGALEMQFQPKEGAPLVDVKSAKETTPAQLRAATGFRVTVKN